MRIEARLKAAEQAAQDEGLNDCPGGCLRRVPIVTWRWGEPRPAPWWCPACGGPPFLTLCIIEPPPHRRLYDTPEGRARYGDERVNSYIASGYTAREETT